MAPQAPLPDPKALKEVTTLTEALAQAQEKLAKAYKNSSTPIKGASDDLDDLRSELGDVSNEMKDVTSLAKKMIAKGSIPLKDVEKLDKRLKDIRKQIKSASTQKGKGSLSKKDMSEQVKIYNELRSKVTGVRKELERVDKGDAGTSFIDSFKKGPKQLQGTAKSLAGFGGAVEAGADKLLGMEGAGAKAAGGILKSFGGMAGGISKLMTGPAGWVAMGIKGLWDMGNAADEFVKNANKRFAYLRGPDIMTSDVKGQFKEFNDELYNTQKNIEVGLNADQVAGFIEALTQAGTHLDKLNTGFQNYRDAVYVASKASKTLGVDLPQVGNMMGELINEFRMNLDDVDKLFVQTAFNAKKAGLTTDKFWNAVENASASMAFWGVKMDGAGKMMAEFSKAQVMGAKDTASTVEEVTQSFVKMTDEQRAAVLGLPGGMAEFKKTINQQQQEFATKVGDLQQEIDLTISQPASKEKDAQLEKLDNQMGGLKAQMKENTKILNTNDPVLLAPYLARASNNTMGILTAMLKGQADGFSDWADVQPSNTLLLKKVSEATGYSSDLILKLHMTASSIETRQDQSIANADNKGKMDLKQGDALDTALNDLLKVSDDSSSTQDDIAKAQDKYAETLNQIKGIDGTSGKDIAHMLTMDNKLGKKFVTQWKKEVKNDKMNLSSLKQSRTQDGLADAELIGSTTDVAKAQDELNDKAEKTFKESVNQTLSFKEMQKIATEEVTWRATSLGVAQAMNSAVAGIFKTLLDHWHMTDSRDSEQARAAQEQLKALGIQNQNGTYTAQTMGEQVKKLNDLNQQMKMAKETDEAKNKDLATLTAKIAATPEGGKKETLKLQKKTLVIEITKNRAHMKEVQDQLDKQSKVIELLGKAGIQNEKMLWFQKQIAMNSDASKKDMSDQLLEMANSGASLDDMKNMGFSATDIEKVIRDANGNLRDEWKNVSKNFNMGSLAGAAATEQYGTGMAARGAVQAKTAEYMGKATMQTPEIVKAPGMVRLDPGETILPKDYKKLQTMAMPDTPAAGAGAGGGSKNITINVSANEKDLAQKIANEIRAVMYRDQLTGQG